MARRYLIIIFAIILSLQASFGQKTLNQKRHRDKDSITILSIDRDISKASPIILEDSLKKSDFHNINHWTDTISDKHKKFAKLIYSFAIIHVKPYKIPITAEDASMRFLPYKGKRVSKVNVKILPPYGVSVYDTIEPDMGSLRWLQKIADNTHIKTSKRLITRQLTTKVGSIINPFVLVQEEISLKSLSNVNDVLIVLNADPLDSEAVIMNVICKDKFSWDGFVESDFNHSFTVKISNSNMFGLGQTLSYKFQYNGKKDQRFSNTINFKYPNIGGSHLDLTFQYRNDYRNKNINFGIERPFLTNKTKWAGGLSVERVFYSYDLTDRNVSWLEEKFDYHTEDLWFGHLFSLGKDYKNFNKTLHASVRTYSTLFNSKPDSLSTDTEHFYYNRLNSLLAIKFMMLKYYKTVQIFDLGRTEFVPHGINAGITCGFETTQKNPSGYIEGYGVLSYFNDRTEHFYSLLVSAGSFINNNIGLNRGFVRILSRHISNPLPIAGNYIMRVYSSLSYLKGFHRYPQEYLFIKDTEILGFRSDTLRGSQKIGLSLSATFFSPTLKYDYRLAFTPFVNIGAISDNNRPLFKSKSYFGIGFRLNVQNNYLLIKNLSIRIAYYPRIPNDAKSFSALISNWSENEFYDHSVTKPAMSVFE